MLWPIQYVLSNNIYLKKYLREHSYYYKMLIRQPSFINELNNMMRASYKMTFPDKLNKMKDDISLLNTMMDIWK